MSAVSTAPPGPPPPPVGATLAAPWPMIDVQPTAVLAVAGRAGDRRRGRPAGRRVAVGGLRLPRRPARQVRALPAYVGLQTALNRTTTALAAPRLGELIRRA